MIVFQKNFYKYTASLAISLIGSEAFKFASSLYIYRITEDFWLVTILYLLIQFPTIIVYLFSSKIVAKFTKISDKAILFICDLISILFLITLIPMFFLIKNSYIFSILLISISSIVGFVHSFRFIYIRNIVYFIANNDSQMWKTNIGSSFATSVGFVLSPILTYFIYQNLSFHYLIIFNCLTYLLSGFLYLLLKTNKEKTVFSEEETKTSEKISEKPHKKWIFVLSSSMIIGIFLYPRASGLPQIFNLLPNFSIETWGFYLNILFSVSSLISSLIQFKLKKIKQIKMSWVVSVISIANLVWLLGLILVKNQSINLILFMIFSSIQQILFSLFISQYYSLTYELFDKDVFHKQNGISLSFRIILSSLVRILLTYFATISALYAFIAYFLIILICAILLLIFQPKLKKVVLN
ncbi:Uncharacterised protein [Mesomycoplasma dispar]|uniref:MFS transporter n=1 Tax=Mesomycoplasma dispar TaxID=86660 RepID=A0AAJ5NS45_9BACT|nr:hypothetical protein [Mesomycoplasma dispar]AJR12347.1 membrane protein [Mesomycoplasma dispar]VEU62198.1 Uncharacterised protein [Mesomycoplasma dispar]